MQTCVRFAPGATLKEVTRFRRMLRRCQLYALPSADSVNNWLIFRRVTHLPVQVAGSLEETIEALSGVVQVYDIETGGDDEESEEV